MMRDYVKEKVLARGKKISMRKGLLHEANPAILPCFKLRGEARVYSSRSRGCYTEQTLGTRRAWTPPMP